MDDFIERIKVRVSGSIRFLDSASWVKPTPTPAPTANEADVDAAEAAIGFAFPSLIRRLYTEVGNGRWGPGYGLYRLPTGGAKPNCEDMVGFYLECVSSERLEESPKVEWPKGLVPLVARGCVDYELCDFLSPSSSLFLLSGDTWDLDRQLSDSLTIVASSLADRLQTWLDSSSYEAGI